VSFPRTFLHLWTFFQISFLILQPCFADTKELEQKRAEEMTLEELENELKALSQELDGLESSWPASFTKRWDMFVTMGSLGLINVLISGSLQRANKERADLHNEIAARNGIAYRVKKVFGDKENENRITELRKRVGEMRRFIDGMDVFVNELPAILKREQPSNRLLLQQARTARDAWLGVSGKRSRTELDAFLNHPTAFSSHWGKNEITSTQWKESFDGLDLLLSKQGAALYQMDNELYGKLNGADPFSSMKPLRPIVAEDKITPDSFPVDPLLIQRTKAAMNELSSEALIDRWDNACELSLARLANSVKHLDGVTKVLYASLFGGGGFLALGLAARVHNMSHTEAVGQIKARRSELDEARAKKRALIEDGEKDLIARWTAAKGKDKEAEDAFNNITYEVLRRNKETFRKAIEHAYKRNSDWETRKTRLDTALSRFDSSDFQSFLAKKVPVAMADAIKSKWSNFQLPQLIQFLSTKDLDIRESELRDVLGLYYGSLMDAIFVQVNPRLTPGRSVSFDVSAFDIEPLVNDTIHRLSGKTFEPQDPGTVVPNPVVPKRPDTKAASSSSTTESAPSVPTDPGKTATIPDTKIAPTDPDRTIPSY
jgi:hypothetical protein